MGIKGLNQGVQLKSMGGVNSLYFTPDSACLLYLPLWWTELTTSPIIDRMNSYSCNVLAASWGYQGRTFDGTDDVILTTDTYDLAANDTITMLAWIKTTSALVQGIMAIGGTYMSIGLAANRLLMAKNYDGSAKTGNSTYTVTDSTWTLVSGSFVDGAVSFFANGVAKDVGVSCTNEVEAGQTLRIGEGGLNVNAKFIGTIGEALIYTRTLSTAEHLNIYELTKWRYDL